jgi:hypothetical protein
LEVQGIIFDRVLNDQITEDWTPVDQMGIQQHIGSLQNVVRDFDIQSGQKKHCLSNLLDITRKGTNIKSQRSP